MKQLHRDSIDHVLQALIETPVPLQSHPLKENSQTPEEFKDSPAQSKRGSLKKSDPLEPIAVNESASFLSRFERKRPSANSTRVSRVSLRKSKAGPLVGSVEVSMERIAIVKSYLIGVYDQFLADKHIARGSLEEREFLVNEYLKHTSDRLFSMMESMIKLKY